MNNEKLGGWVIAGLMLAGLCYAASYSLPYVKGIFYGPMMEATGASNTQLGLIMSIYGFGNVVFNLIGGYFADKFNYRKCIIYSLLGTTLLSAWLALNPSIITMYIVWGLFGLTTFFVFNPAIFKMPRMIVPDALIGKSVGMFAFGQAISFMIINFVALYVYDGSMASNTAADAFGHTVWVYAAFTLLAAVGCVIIFNKIQDVNQEGDEEKFSFDQIKFVIKQPGLWMMTICGFCMYLTTQTASYFVPYFNSVFGVAVTFSGVLGVINMYGGRIFSPIIGAIATKTQFVSRIVAIGAVILITLFVAVLMFAMNMPFYLLVGVTLGTGIFSTLFTNICLAMPPEAQIPRNATGTAMGIYAAIAYSPDLFIHTYIGWALDTYGDTGYSIMMVTTIAILAIGGIVAWKLYQKCRAAAALVTA
jgi:Sugar phosphate permease